MSYTLGLSLSKPISCLIGKQCGAALASLHEYVCMMNKYWAECDVSWVDFMIRTHDYFIC